MIEEEKIIAELIRSRLPTQRGIIIKYRTVISQMLLVRYILCNAKQPDIQKTKNKQTNKQTTPKKNLP